MALPELYRYGREGLWFGTWPFIIYMMEGVYQVCLSIFALKFLDCKPSTLQSAVVFFLILYSYISTTSRKDGYDIYMYEFSTVSSLLSCTPTEL